MQIEARNRSNRDPTSATMDATLTEKTQGFAPESVFKPEYTRSHDDHDDDDDGDDDDEMMMMMMVMMMMWLT